MATDNIDYSGIYQTIWDKEGPTEKHVFATTPLGLVLVIVSASISFVSCSIVLIIIARSQERLSSTYHRIMGMSSMCLLVASLAIAFTTIPMPKDVIFDYAGKSYGNVTTCTIQGLAYLFGYNLNFYLEKALITFYFLRIGLCVRQKYLTRFFDPLFIAVVIWVFLSLKADTANFENINPSAIKPWCSNIMYPPKCGGSAVGKYADILNVECIRGKYTTPILYMDPFAYLITNMVFGVSNLLLTIFLVYRRERKIKVMVPTKMNTISGEELVLTRIKNELVQTKIIMKQAILAVVVHTMNQVLTSDVPLIVQKNVLNHFVPLKGLWILVIFLYDKICTERYLKEGLSFGEALKIVILHPYDRPAVTIVGLDIVRFHENKQADGAVHEPWVREGMDEDEDMSGIELTSVPEPEGPWEDDSNSKGISYGLSDNNSNGISYGDEGSRGFSGGAVSSTGIKSVKDGKGDVQDIPEGGYYANLRKKSRM